MHAHDIRRLAVEAVCDERTVRAFLAGRPIRCTSRVRLEAALRRLRMPPPAMPNARQAESKARR